jgi:hypothetical protein
MHGLEHIEMVTPQIESQLTWFIMSEINSDTIQRHAVALVN